jgi:hypothetical protein
MIDRFPDPMIHTFSGPPAKVSVERNLFRVSQLSESTREKYEATEKGFSSVAL